MSKTLRLNKALLAHLNKAFLAHPTHVNKAILAHSSEPIGAYKTMLCMPMLCLILSPKLSRFSMSLHTFQRPSGHCQPLLVVNPLSTLMRPITIHQIWEACVPMVYETIHEILSTVRITTKIIQNGEIHTQRGQSVNKGRRWRL